MASIVKKKRFHRTYPDDPAGVHYGYSVCIAGNDSEIVGNEYRTCPSPLNRIMKKVKNLSCRVARQGQSWARQRSRAELQLKTQWRSELVAPSHRSASKGTA